MPTALITGITGQDGSYLAEFLLAKGYRVVGIVRRSSTTPYERIGHLVDRVELCSADLLDQTSLTDVVHDTQPDEIYNLAAQSFVQTSWSQPVLTGEFTALGVTRMLEAMKKAAPKARFYQASSSEMFGKVVEVPQRESTPFYPRSPYGVAKVYGHWITLNYRESFGLYAVSGILFNHESPRRGLEFVTRKVTDGAARCKLASRRSSSSATWRHAATGASPATTWTRCGGCSSRTSRTTTSSPRARPGRCGSSASSPSRHVGLDYQDFVKHDTKFDRPAEVDLLVGDASKAREHLGWEPTVRSAQLVEMMVEADLARHAAREVTTRALVTGG